MPYLFGEEEIKSTANLLGLLKKDELRLRRVFGNKLRVWFRGLRNIHNPQIPTFHRDGYKIEDEIYLMNLFKQNSYEFLSSIPNSEWEWMFLMRHHHLPSRLLDWTENPLISLYFAVRPRENKIVDTNDGVLWCMLPKVLNQWSLKWPLSNNSLPMFTEDKAEYTLGENAGLELYLPSKMSHLPLKETLTPAAGICVRTNRRMQAQMGVFTIHHNDTKPLEEVQDGSHIWQYRVPLNKKVIIFDELRRAGITEHSVFPDLDNVALDAINSLGGT